MRRVYEQARAFVRAPSGGKRAFRHGGLCVWGVAIVVVAVAACGSSSDGARAPSRAAQAPDRAFVTQIVPDDQLAVKLSTLARSRAAHPQLRSFAATLVSAEDAQIAQLRRIAAKLGVTPGPVNPTDMTPMQRDSMALGIQMYQTGIDQVNTALPRLASSSPFDKALIATLITHHKGAINMAHGELAHGNNRALRAIASTILTDDARQLTQLQRWQAAWYG